MKDAVVLRNDVKEATTLKTPWDQQAVLPLFLKGEHFKLKPPSKQVRFNIQWSKINKTRPSKE